MIPTVFLHGFLGAETSWDGVVSLFTGRGEMQAISLPGHGPRPWIPGVGEIGRDERSLRGRASCTTFEEAIDAFVRKLPDRAHLVGYSMGARVALGILARHPDRVASLVAVGLHPGLTDDTERRARRSWDEELARDLESDGLVSFVDAWEKLPIWDTQKSLPEAVRARRREERLAQIPAAIAWAQRTLGLGVMPAMWETLARTTVPVHLVTGARDEKFTALAHRILEKAPACLHTAVGGAGHDVGLESPEALASIIRIRTGA